MPKYLRSEVPKIEVKIVGKFIPEYQSEKASGCDLYADIEEDITLRAGTYCTVPTGIMVEIPDGYEAQIRPRSGLAQRYGIGVLNTPGTIDADYRGEIKVILFNLGSEPFNIGSGDRIAQLVFNQVVRGEFIQVEHLKDTKRGSRGFGHTGK